MFPLSQRLLPEMFSSEWIFPSYICDARRPGEKTALPFRWVTAGKTQRNHKGKLCSDLAMEWSGCTHIPEIHTSHSTHSSCLSTALWMPKQKMNLQKPVQPAPNLQPSHQAAPKLLL